MSPAVQLEGCTVRLKRATVLDRLDLTVETGTVVGIRGYNGSGKSTLLRVVAGLIAPESGSVRVLGLAPTTRTPSPRIGAAIDAPALYGWMSATGYLRTLLDLAGQPDDGEAARALERFGLQTVGRKRIFRYSQGMKKRLALAAATLGDPPVVLLDEPTNALDGQGEALVADWVRANRDAGRTVLLATHRPLDEQLCDRVLQLVDGRLGDPAPVGVGHG